MPIQNPKLHDYAFLASMYSDGYFPFFLVEKCKAILVGLCEDIERAAPKSNAELLALTHKATEAINDLQAEFEENESEIETGAREALGEDFDFIVKAYGFDIDVEEVIATRDW